MFARNFTLLPLIAGLGIFAAPHVRGDDAAALVETAPTPEWVAELPLDTDRPFDTTANGDGLRYHHVEYQSAALDEITRYRRIAYEVTTHEAVGDNSSLSFAFSPGEETLTLHRLNVIRGGITTERLPDQEIRILQRETSLERNLYDGRMSAHILLEDIRVGDIIDYAYSIRGGDQTLGGRFFSQVSLEFSRPVGRHYVRHLGDPARPFHHRAHLTELTPDVRETSQAREYIWDQFDVPGTRHESNTPNWHFAYPTLELGEFAEWAEVVEWAYPLYESGEALPAELREIADTWRDLPAEQQIAEALRFVQSEVRYVAMAMGPHSYQPYPLELIWTRKFGDCKDKTQLLVALLRHLGITSAWPALVETDYGKILPRTLPGPLAFDHVLVHVRHGDVDYWLEPTAARQEGPLGQIYGHDLGYALVIRPGESELREMRPQAYANSRTDVEEHFHVAAYGEPVGFKVVTRYFGRAADSLRASFQRNARVDTAENYVSFYRNTYPGLRQLALPDSEDDLESNIFTVTETYEIDDFFTREDESDPDFHTILRAALIDDARTETGNLDRVAPHRLPHPLNISQTIHLTLPGPATFEAEDIRIENTSASYHQTVAHKRNKLIIRHRYQTLRDHVAPEDLEDFRAMTNRIYQITDYPIRIPTEHFGVAVEAETETPAWAGIAIACLIAVALLCGAVVAALLVFMPIGRSKPPRPTSDGPKGIGGWLAIMGISVITAPLFILWQLNQSIRDVHRELLNTAANFGQYPELAWWSAVMTSELIINVFLLPLTIANIILYLSKRRIFPRVHIAIMAGMVITSLVILLGIQAIDREAVEGEYIGAVIRATIVAAIWTWYLLASRRVRNTFVTFPGKARATPPALPATPAEAR